MSKRGNGKQSNKTLLSADADEGVFVVFFSLPRGCTYNDSYLSHKVLGVRDQNADGWSFLQSGARMERVTGVLVFFILPMSRLQNLGLMDTAPGMRCLPITMQLWVRAFFHELPWLMVWLSLNPSFSGLAGMITILRGPSVTLWSFTRYSPIGSIERVCSTVSEKCDPLTRRVPWV